MHLLDSPRDQISYFFLVPPIERGGKAILLSLVYVWSGCYSGCWSHRDRASRQGSRNCRAPARTECASAPDQAASFSTFRPGISGRRGPDVCQGLAGSVPEAEDAAAVAPGTRPLGNKGPFRSRDASAAVAVAAEADRTPHYLGGWGRERPAWVALQAFRLAVRTFGILPPRSHLVGAHVGARDLVGDAVDLGFGESLP